MSPRRALLALPALVALATAFSCTFGDEDAGCRGDAECPAGFRCRAGACFRFTTAPSTPNDPLDSDGGDGGGSGAGGSDAAPDAPEDA